MATYQTKNGDKTGFVPGVGAIVNGLLKNAPEDLESPNLVKVADENLAKANVPAPAPNVAAAPAASQPPAQNPAPQTNTQTTNKESA